MNGLRSDPCIPSDWKGFSAVRQFRGKSIQIEVKNPNRVCKGVQSLTLNGTSLPGSLIPIEKLAENNKVVVVMG